MTTRPSLPAISAGLLAGFVGFSSSFSVVLQGLSGVGATPAEAYGAGQPVDMMDKASALPTSPQAQQQKQDVINKDLAA